MKTWCSLAVMQSPAVWPFHAGKHQAAYTGNLSLPFLWFQPVVGPGCTLCLQVLRNTSASFWQISLFALAGLVRLFFLIKEKKKKKSLEDTSIYLLIYLILECPLSFLAMWQQHHKNNVQEVPLVMITFHPHGKNREVRRDKGSREKKSRKGWQHSL